MNLKSVSVPKLMLEAFAIFLGVTAGFLAEDYREYRNEREKEREALTQIIRDLELDADDISPIVQRSRGVADAMVWLHNNLRRVDVPIDSVMLVVNSIPDVHSYEAANAAYTGLKAAGHLDLIQDPVLLDSLFYYFEDRQAAMEALNGWILEGDIRLWDRLAPHIVFEMSSTLADRPTVTEVDLVRMQRDEMLSSELVWNGGVNERQARDGQVILELNARLAASVTGRLEVR